MYSPKISKEFIPVLYQKAKDEKFPMTKLVNRIIEQFLYNRENPVAHEGEEKK